MIEMTPEQNDIVLKGMWGVVNDGGTGGRDQDAELGDRRQDRHGTGRRARQGLGRNKDHAWFVSFAPAYKPEISVIALIENSGFGAANAAPAAKAMYEAYLAKSGEPPTGDIRQTVSAEVTAAKF